MRGGQGGGLKGGGGGGGGEGGIRQWGMGEGGGTVGEGEERRDRAVQGWVTGGGRGWGGAQSAHLGRNAAGEDS